MQIIKGDILDFQEGVIVHQANCQRKAGAGLALAIRRKYPGWFENWVESEFVQLGAVHFYEVSNKLVIASIFGQNQIGRVFSREQKQYTNYEALENGFRIVNNLAPSEWSVYIPKGIGCGLGGGDWNIVEKIIEKEIPRAILVEKE